MNGHEHSCAMCRERYVCLIPDCTITRHGVCPHPSCIAAWEDESEPEEGERHPAGCCCAEHADNWCLEDLTAGLPSRA